MHRLHTLLIFLMLVCCSPPTTYAERIIGMRVDPAYLYESHFKSAGVTGAQSAARLIVRDAKQMGVNRIFFYVYNSQFGAFYPTDYPDTVVEAGLGKQDILKHLLKEADENKIRVVAVTPINNFFTAWRTHPKWRLHLFGKYNITPVGSHYILSAWNPQFNRWVMGLLEDLIKRYPLLQGVEIVEPQIDPHWQLASVIKKKFLNNRSPHTNGEDFIHYHARGLTQLLGRAGALLHRNNKQFFISQSWTANSKGKLIKAGKIKESSGFDFSAILNLPPQQRPDYLIVELIWQQWRVTHKKRIFNPQWTLSAVRQCQKKISAKVKLIAHVEITPWGNIIPSAKEFKQTLRLALKANRSGISFYDYSQLKKMALRITFSQLIQGL